MNESKAPKVVLINGSPHKNGTTDRALSELQATLESEGIECVKIWIGAKVVGGCIACGSCRRNGKCFQEDAVNAIAEEFRDADGLVVGSPVYYASPNGGLLGVMDRLFYSSPFDKTMKVGASVAVARRGGCTATFDVLNKYFTISGMPIASSSYWNQVHGAVAEDAEEDKEGLQTMRNLGHNMAFLIKSIRLGKEALPFPVKENGSKTNFIKRN